MRYKVHFENNIPVKALPVKNVDRGKDVTEFGEENGKTVMKYLCVEAENETDAIKQAKRIAETIFKFD